MKNYKGYILVAEITKRANMSAPWLHSASYGHIELISCIPVVLKSSLPEKYQEVANLCQDLEYYYPYCDFSKEIGRTQDFMSVLSYQRKKANKKPFDEIKIGGYRLIKLNDEFIELINKGLTPYKLHQKYDENDYKYIIDFQDMKIGFY